MMPHRAETNWQILQLKHIYILGAFLSNSSQKMMPHRAETKWQILQLKHIYIFLVKRMTI